MGHQVKKNEAKVGNFILDRVWEHCCDYIMHVIKDMIDVRDEFKESQGFSREEVEGFKEIHFFFNKIK